MSIADIASVIPLSKKQCEQFVRQKHYSRRPCIFWAGFGLIVGGKVDGVVVYGQPSPQLAKSAFSDRDFRLYELGRLVVQTDLPNAASFLIARSLDQLPMPCAVVSYADSAWGHAGIVYQATNWLYTGSTKSHDHLYLIDGQRVHPMSLRDQGITNPKQWAKENGIQTVAPDPKHRYFKVLGNKGQRKRMLRTLAYPVLPNYPKAPKSRYDDGPRIKMAIGGPKHSLSALEFFAIV